MDENLKRGPVYLDELVTVEAVYDPQERWNGFLCPRLDQDAIETVMAAFLGYGGKPDPHSPSHRWDGDVLIVSEYDGTDEHTETVHADADGLYALGARSWIWTADESRSIPVQDASAGQRDARVLNLDDWRRGRSPATKDQGEDA